MKRFLLVVLSVGIVASFSGCIYHDVTAPGMVQTGTVFNLSSNDFEVIDRVSAMGETTLWFGMVMTGGEGYQALLAEAQKLGGDEIMNYSFDIEQTGVFMFIYSNVKWKATGLAVKFKDHVRRK
ncbi:MAG: hypothetical protein GY866_31260 [Proteobacteria bacterium]|nr:hypothetical protein [Pseudomonadota bacterium]